MKYKILSAIISSSIIGIVFGFLSNYSILQGSWLNLVVWAAVGILIGLFMEDGDLVNWLGPFYGLFLSVSFLISGFHGAADQIMPFLLLVCVLSILGVFCGWCLVRSAYWLKRKFIK
jgi:hypothetical protein